ncbi:MAG: 3-deoxy-D-manno-octulosonic acid transferase [Candidatus Aminicenantes bacterium]|nr:3-deoxy-D-manno-octulosonic acid transferase [Candidatus Aminicenantes bacterium]
MIYLYTLIYAFLLLGYFPLFLWKFNCKRKERLDLSSRLALKLPLPSPRGQPCLWIHAVSVGEVLSLQSLVEKWKGLHPEWRLLVTSLTPAGLKVAKEKLLKAEVRPIPIDLPCCLQRFFKRVKPSLLALTESEFWPNLIWVAHKNSVPVILINGRMSERSFQRIKKFRLFFLPFLKLIDLFLVQSLIEKQRLIEIGVAEEKIRITGNLKTEIKLPLFTDEERAKFRKKMGLSSKEKIITAGSTHPGEEEILLRAFIELKKYKSEYRLIIAPRHPARWAEIANLCSQLSVHWQRWSLIKNKNQEENLDKSSWEVLIVDTLGELPFFYFLADLTFIGGSLVQRGGHNLLEPAFYGKPIIFGPHMENFLFLADYFLERQAALKVANQQELVEIWSHREEELFMRIGERAKKALTELEGATDKTIACIEEIIKRISQKKKEEEII